MKISLNWLQDYITLLETDPQAISDRVTCSVAEVDEVEVQGEILENCCVGKVLKCEKHPNADKLTLCDVATDRGDVRVVCGGTNLYEGMLVAFAHEGAVVRWHGEEMMTLKKTKIRGEESRGMICAAEELDLGGVFPEATGHSIIDLGDGGYEVGASLRVALGLTDVILHIDNHAITHRADLFSHIGFAREFVAIGLGEWKKRPQMNPVKCGRKKMTFKCINECPNQISRYLACQLSIKEEGETPDWMKQRLVAVGSRPISLPIDITNFVMWEYGMPLHCFDADDFRGHIHMREADEGEKVTTLDGEERKLPEGAIVISDDEGIFDLLGIMGGLRTSTKHETRNVYLHSAAVDPMRIRKSIIATGHRTDAATIYEKGIPHVTAEAGFYRALQLFLDLVPGAKIVSVLEEYGENGIGTPIALPVFDVCKLLGRNVSVSEISDALTALDFTVDTKRTKKTGEIIVVPPLHRLGDISASYDLIEEVARITGFETFEEQMPQASIVPPARDHRLNAVRDALKEERFFETVQYAFLGEGLLQKTGLEFGDALRVIENPIGEDMKIMRPSLLPRLLQHLNENMKHTEGELRSFEVGHTFLGKSETNMMTILLARRGENALKEEPMLHLQSVLQRIGFAINQKIVIDSSVATAGHMHPGRSAALLSDKNVVGAFYEVHPMVCKNFDLDVRIAVCEINLDVLLCGDFYAYACKDLLEFPSISYDTTISVGGDVVVGDLLAKAQGMDSLLQGIELVDLFEKDGARQLTFRCTYNGNNRTLTEEEVQPVHEKVVAVLTV